MSLKRPPGPAGAALVLELHSRILKDSPLGDPHLRKLSAFVEDMKASGFVAEALRRHAIEGAAVAPAGNRPG